MRHGREGEFFSKGQGARGKGQGARGKGQGARGKGQGARGKGQGARGKGQGARGKGQGARGKGQAVDYQNASGPHLCGPLVILLLQARWAMGACPRLARLDIIIIVHTNTSSKSTGNITSPRICHAENKFHCIRINILCIYIYTLTSTCYKLRHTRVALSQFNEDDVCISSSFGNTSPICTSLRIILILRNRNRCQNTNNRHHNQQLDQGKTALRLVELRLLHHLVHLMPLASCPPWPSGLRLFSARAGLPLARLAPAPLALPFAFEGPHHIAPIQPPLDTYITLRTAPPQGEFLALSLPGARGTSCLPAKG